MGRGAMISPPNQVFFTPNINQIIFSLGYEKLGNFWIIFTKMSRLKLHGRFIYYLHLPDQLIFVSTKLNDGKKPIAPPFTKLNNHPLKRVSVLIVCDESNVLTRRYVQSCK